MGVTDAQIKRINELARKAKQTGLTDTEREEQQRLRTAYVAAFRESLRSTLEHTTIIEPNGRVRKAGQAADSHSKGNHSK